MLRAGVIGGGFGAAVHLPALGLVPGVSLVAVADGGSGRMAAAAPAASYFPSGARLIAEAAIDLVILAVPPGQHVDLVGAAVARGLAILCEKPFGRSLPEAAAMTAAASGLVGAVDYQFRYEPGLLALRRAIKAGRIGRLRRLTVNWVTAGRADPRRPWGFQHDAAAGGGVSESFLCHSLDYLGWLTGAAITAIWGRGEILVPRRPTPDGGPRPVTAEDSIDALVAFADGTTASLWVTNCQPGGAWHRIGAYGDQGWLVLSLPLPGGAYGLTGSDGADESGPPERGDSRIAAVGAVLADLVRAIGGDPAPDLPRFADGLAVRVALAALSRARETGATQSLNAPGLLAPSPDQPI